MHMMILQIHQATMLTLPLSSQNRKRSMFNIIQHNVVLFCLSATNVFNMFKNHCVFKQYICSPIYSVYSAPLCVSVSCTRYTKILNIYEHLIFSSSGPKILYFRNPLGQLESNFVGMFIRWSYKVNGFFWLIRNTQKKQ